ncbi:hypothetical protein FocTR4_00014368 [Fusarium oxysporum f. sp. cubense]|uniref:Uncharacterized protein n=1 Tax=Fusarium oxysporum f. sp. cubense TaxID=61366 RepID=A0A5C6SPN6_FUSOC|nr:hypothetical protein FocTR4_00014368 [Fusarium oxysporum f. sp. cubense]
MTTSQRGFSLNCLSLSRQEFSLCRKGDWVMNGLYYQVKGLTAVTAVKPHTRFRRGTYVGRCRADYLQQLTKWRASAVLGMALRCSPGTGKSLGARQGQIPKKAWDTIALRTQCERLRSVELRMNNRQGRVVYLGGDLRMPSVYRVLGLN